MIKLTLKTMSFTKEVHFGLTENILFLPSINPEMRFELSMKNYLHLRLLQIDPDCHSISHTKFKKRKEILNQILIFFVKDV